MSSRTLFDKVWADHLIAELGDGFCLLHVDRHLLHDLGGPRGLADLAKRGLPVRNPDLTFATPDHAISSAPARAGTSETGIRLHTGLRTGTQAAGVRLFDIQSVGHAHT